MIQAHKKRELLGHRGAIYCLTNYSDSHFLSGGGDGLIVRWPWKDSDEGKALADVEEQVFAITYMAKNNLVVCGAFSGDLYFIDPDRKSAPRRMSLHKKGIFDLLPIEDRLLVAGGDGRLSIWKPDQLELSESLVISHQSLRNLHFDADRNLLYIGASDSNIYVLTWPQMRLVETLNSAHDPSVFSLLSLSAGVLLSAGRDARIRAWSKDDFSPLWSVDAHWYTVNKMVSIGNHQIVASASRDKTIRLWSAPDFELLKVIDKEKYGAHINSVNDLLWNPSTHQLISTGDDQRIIDWELHL